MASPRSTAHFLPPRAAVAAAVLLAGNVAVGCLDPSPYYLDVDAAAPPPRDAGADGGGCGRCLNAPDQPGPGCATEVAACQMDPVCRDTFACFQTRCEGLTSQEQVVGCGLPCAQEAGLTSTAGSTFTLATNVFNCLLGACLGACTH
jgi:hypothetical protein